MDGQIKVQNEQVENEYLNNCSFRLADVQYLELEKRRKGNVWISIITKQEFKCYYCESDIRDIQKLICNRIIGLRKRGKLGFSGLHLELDHKNANKQDNSIANLVAACYYCNNDKSNVINDVIFLNYFGPQRKRVFYKLLHDYLIYSDNFFMHNKRL